MAGAVWSRIVNSTIKNYIRERENNTLRARKTLAMLKKKGRITFNWSGYACDWKVKYKRVKMTTFNDGDTLDFARKDRNKTATLDWRGYASTDAMTKIEFLQNRSTEAIVKLYSSLSSDLMDDMEDEFGEEIYNNGYASGYDDRIHGLESFFAATTNSGNGACSPTGSYAGLSCIPGQYGGAWQGGGFNSLANNGWPNGRGDANFDFWSPIVVDYGDPLFGSTHTWAANCVEAISFGTVKSKKSVSKKGMLDLWMLDDEMYRQYLTQARAKERIVVKPDAATSDLVSLGFQDVINQDGTDITSEFGMTPGVGYGLNFDMIELRSMQGQLFVPEGPDQDIASKLWRFSVDFFGNMAFNPKFQVKLINLTNPSDAV